MGIGQLVGRILLALIFIGAGVTKFQKPDQSIAYFNSKYPVAHDAFVKLTGLNLPDQLKPSFIKSVSSEIIQAAGGVEILGGLLVILNVSLGGYLLQLFIMGTIAIMHNPFLSADSKAQLQDMEQTLLNLGILGGLMLVSCCRVGCCAKSCSAAQGDKKKTSQTKQPQQQGKATGKRNNKRE